MTFSLDAWLDAVPAAVLELVDEAQDPGAALARIVQADVELRDSLDPEAHAQLVPDERHRVGERGDRGGPLGLGADDAHPDLGMPKVRRRLHVGDRGKPDPGIGNVTGQQLPDLLSEQLIDAVSSLGHGMPDPVRRGDPRTSVIGSPSALRSIR